MRILARHGKGFKYWLSVMTNSARIRRLYRYLCQKCFYYVDNVCNTKSFNFVSAIRVLLNNSDLQGGTIEARLMNFTNMVV